MKRPLLALSFLLAAGACTAADDGVPPGPAPPPALDTLLATPQRFQLDDADAAVRLRASIDR
ncbi:MAG TPA: hypothetical protein VL172_22705, partial [Kofleriaceae bacterium]|nr:hypothetical protein [Kofleriaceae bacterium]